MDAKSNQPLVSRHPPTNGLITNSPAAADDRGDFPSGRSTRRNKRGAPQQWADACVGAPTEEPTGGERRVTAQVVAGEQTRCGVAAAWQVCSK
jgi:hypothetical protein